MKLKVIKSGLEEIRPLRELFLHEGNFQFIYNKCHGGWADEYLFTIDGITAGYGAVWGATSGKTGTLFLNFTWQPRTGNLQAWFLKNFIRRAALYWLNAKATICF